ncbi:hypothetical protein RvVAR0630_41490 [Agrobacterium vitis]|uniref:hypothetical protein n=1 Tax=Agrobacterium vitis TaxID=373 RepID=UPI0012E92D62|nr:hypothetical protein [Agrobacterium vitis]MVA69809.1 hypothetical protein [Agrobacterium vitis]BCH61525.1 hypothetical protein RvVAR0630_41490 [Agrobacterium vitis]
MTDATPETMRGRINAHRELLISLLTASLQGPEAFKDLIRSLEQESQLSDGQEDPGAVPNRALSEAVAKARETRDILQAAKARAADTSTEPLS